MVNTILDIETELIKQVKAFHPVFLDIVERISSQLEQLRVDREKGIPVGFSCLRSMYTSDLPRHSSTIFVYCKFSSSRHLVS